MLELLNLRKVAAFLRGDTVVQIAMNWWVINHFERNLDLAKTDRYRFKTIRKTAVRDMIEKLRSKQLAGQQKSADECRT